MIHFNRKTEYALIAVEYMARKKASAGEAVASAREIAEATRIPYPLLAKIMQKLAAKGMIKAVQGTKGGYILAARPQDVSVADVVEVFDGRIAVTECLKEEKITCPQWDGCHIKDPVYELNHKIHDLLVQMKITDLMGRGEKSYV